MRYRIVATVAAVIASLILIRSSHGENPATQPASTQPAKILLSRLPASLVQKVDGTDSGASDFKVIRLTPPAEYLNWFKQQTGSNVFDMNHVEVTPFQDDVRLAHSGPGGMSASVENVVLGKLVDWGWEVTELKKSSSAMNFRYECSISGIIRVDIRPDRQFDFPFEAKITCDPQKSDNVFEPHPPLHATVTWQKPECWKKDEK